MVCAAPLWAGNLRLQSAAGSWSIVISHWGGFVYAAATAQEGVSEPPRIFPGGGAYRHGHRLAAADGACRRFLPALQRHILRQGEQLALENELWQRVHAVGKTSAARRVLPGSCGGAGLELAAGGECLIVRWDANSNGRWETSSAAAWAESTGFRLRDGALETLRGASDCRGGGWEKITNPAAIVVTRFSVQRQVTPGFAPELSVTLAARSAQQTGLTSEVEQRVTGYNL